MDAVGFMGSDPHVRLQIGYRILGAMEPGAARRIYPRSKRLVALKLRPNRPDQGLPDHPPEDHILRAFLNRRDHAKEIKEAAELRARNYEAAAAARAFHERERERYRVFRAEVEAELEAERIGAARWVRIASEAKRKARAEAKEKATAEKEARVIERALAKAKREEEARRKRAKRAKREAEREERRAGEEWVTVGVAQAKRLKDHGVWVRWKKDAGFVVQRRWLKHLTEGKGPI